MTTFLWVLAAVGAVILAWFLAIGLSRMAGGHGATAPSLPHDSGKTRYELDNERPFNTAAFITVALVVGGIVALILALEYA